LRPHSSDCPQLCALVLFLQLRHLTITTPSAAQTEDPVPPINETEPAWSTCSTLLLLGATGVDKHVAQRWRQVLFGESGAMAILAYIVLAAQNLSTLQCHLSDSNHGSTVLDLLQTQLNVAPSMLWPHLKELDLQVNNNVTQLFPLLSSLEKLDIRGGSDEAIFSDHTPIHDDPYLGAFGLPKVVCHGARCSKSRRTAPTRGPTPSRPVVERRNQVRRVAQSTC
jgi:hypothetical protein